MLSIGILLSIRAKLPAAAARSFTDIFFMVLKLVVVAFLVGT